jgi:hypothetical protein
MKTQALFSGKWVRTKPLPFSEPTQPTLRKSQARTFAALKDKQRVVLQAPTGWGKSLVIASLVLYKLLRNPDFRCIIAVPQTLIARGFVRDWKLKVAGRLVDWVVQHNLCHKQATDTVANLICFLQGYAGGASPPTRQVCLLLSPVRMPVASARVRDQEVGQQPPDFLTFAA